MEVFSRVTHHKYKYFDIKSNNNYLLQFQTKTESNNKTRVVSRNIRNSKNIYNLQIIHNQL